MICFVMMDTAEGELLPGSLVTLDLERQSLLQLISGDYLDSWPEILPPSFHCSLQLFGQHERVPMVGIQRPIVEKCQGCYEEECQCPNWVPRTEDLCA